MLIYNNSRWRVVASMPRLWFLGVESTTLAAQENDHARTSAGQNLLRFTLTGNQDLTGIVPQADQSNGEIIGIYNIDTVDTLTVKQASASSAAANRFNLPFQQDIAIGPQCTAWFAYDATSSRWRLLGAVQQLPFKNQPTNIAGDTLVWDNLNSDWAVQQAGVPYRDTSADFEIWEEQRFGYLTLVSSGLTTAALDAFVGITNGQASQWIVFANASAGSVTGGAPQQGHNGLLALTTGTTSSQYACLTMCLNRAAANSGIIQSTNLRSVDWFVQIATATTVECVVGFGVDSSAGSAGTSFGTDSVFFVFNPATNANWQCVTRKTSTNTTTTTGVAGGTTWKRLCIWIHPTNPAGEVRFYIDNVLVATHTTNIPTTAVVIGARIQTLTAALRILTIDHVKITANTSTMLQ
jgi:hypothetical protein